MFIFQIKQNYIFQVNIYLVISKIDYTQSYKLSPLQMNWFRFTRLLSVLHL